jgi:hypothetical protein
MASRTRRGSIRAALLAVITLVSAPACYRSYVITTMLGPKPTKLEPRAPTAVEVLSSGSPTRPHVDVALLHAHVDNFHDRGVLIEALRTEAAGLGCDAIVIANVIWPNADATCVVYVPQAPEACADSNCSSSRAEARLLGAKE